MIKISLILASIMFSMASTISQAEVISITDPRYDVANSTEGVLRPVRGMSMAQVEQQFGRAEQQGLAVGEPPITRWVYNDFIVFFEFNTVIHSVVPR